jgi:hypothetical protein
MSSTRPSRSCGPLRDALARYAYGLHGDFARLLIPAELDGHYNAVCRAFEEGDLTAPSLAISNVALARAIPEFTGPSAK